MSEPLKEPLTRVMRAPSPFPFPCDDPGDTTAFFFLGPGHDSQVWRIHATEPGARAIFQAYSGDINGLDQTKPPCGVEPGR